MEQLRNIPVILLGLTSLTSYGQAEIETDIGEATGDFSAYSVSLSDDHMAMAIGAYHNVGEISESGHVRVYTNDTGVWRQIGADINGEAVGDWSGYSVSLSNDGTTVAIGAVINGGNGKNSGHVRVYKYNAGVWSQVGADIDGEAAGDWSGYSVSLSNDGTIVAVGAIFNNGNGKNSGHVRIYKNSAGVWSQVGADIDGKVAWDYFGTSVGLSDDGTIVAIGAHQGGRPPGYVSVYKNVLGDWIQVGNDIKGEATGNFSGWSVGLSNDGAKAAIGAYLKNDGERLGYVRVYENEYGDWTQIGTDIDGKETGDDLSALSVGGVFENGSIVLIGAYEEKSDDTEQKLGVGHVRVYENKNNYGAWTRISADMYKGQSNGL